MELWDGRLCSGLIAKGMLWVQWFLLCVFVTSVCCATCAGLPLLCVRPRYSTILSPLPGHTCVTQLGVACLHPLPHFLVVASVFLFFQRHCGRLSPEQRTEATDTCRRQKTRPKKKTNTGRAAEQRSAVPCGKSEQRSDPQPSDPCLGAHRILTPCPAVVKRGTPDRLRWFSTAHMPNGLACGGFPTMPFKTRRVDRWPSRIGPGNALTLLDPDCLSLRLQQAMPETMFTVHLPCSTMPQMHTAEIIIHYHAGL